MIEKQSVEWEKGDLSENYKLGKTVFETQKMLLNTLKKSLTDGIDIDTDYNLDTSLRDMGIKG